MIKKYYIKFCFILLSAICFSNCAGSRIPDLSLKNTLSIFLLKNENGYFFCIPVQYMHDFQIDNFDLKSGKIVTGNYEILLDKEQLNISVFKLDDNEDYNHYYIFIEKHLTNDEYKNIVSEYKKGNVKSRFEIWYDLIIDNEEQPGNGILDDFELFDGIAIDPEFFPQNLDFFKERYY